MNNTANEGALAHDWDWIETPEALEALCAHVAQQPAFALDLESDNFHVYTPRTCLLQLATVDRLALIDILALDNAIDPLAAVLEDPSIEVVMHGADNDLSALRYELSVTVHNLFDTQEAARYLGLRKTGLGSLLDIHFGVRLSKRFQRLNWSRRPLPEQALAYAAMDVRHLLELRDQLCVQLDEVALHQAVRQSGEWCAANPAKPSDFDPGGFRRIKGAHAIGGHQRAVLKALWMWRHERCKATNRSHLFILTDGAMLALARQLPKNHVGLKNIQSLTPKQCARYGDDLLDAIAAGLKAPPEPRKPPHAEAPPPRMSRVDRELFDHLRRWRTDTAEREGVPAEVVATSRLISEVVRIKPRDLETLSSVPGFLSWRVERYGDALLVEIARRIA